jgi:hypothetical protein
VSIPLLPDTVRYVYIKAYAIDDTIMRLPQSIETMELSIYGVFDTYIEFWPKNLKNLEIDITETNSIPSEISMLPESLEFCSLKLSNYNYFLEFPKNLKYLSIYSKTKYTHNLEYNLPDSIEILELSPMFCDNLTSWTKIPKNCNTIIYRNCSKEDYKLFSEKKLKVILCKKNKLNIVYDILDLYFENSYV